MSTDLQRLCSDEAAVERVARAINSRAFDNGYWRQGSANPRPPALPTAQEYAMRSTRSAARRALAEMAKIAEEERHAGP